MNIELNFPSWDEWIEQVKKLAGHDLNQDEAVVDPYDAYQDGKSPMAYVASII